MAHVGIVSAAYWGDVMPYVPIADELVRRGHRVSLCVPEGFHDVLAGHGFDLVHLGTDFSPRELAAHGDIMEKADTIRGMRAALDLWLKQLTIDPAPRILEVLDGVAPDLWLSHPTAFWLPEIPAETNGTPIAVGHLFPMMMPSAEQPPPMLPGGGMPALWPLGWRMGRAMMKRMAYDDEINRIRAERGLPPGEASAGFGFERADRVLVLTSQHYWRRPSDWADNVELTGFTVWGSPDDDLPDDLAAYVDAGEPPVVVTLGTSAATNARDGFEVAAEAITSAGHRPLLLVGNERNRAALEDRGDVWTFASLPAVLERSRAIVHAGGHGSVAAALHAGVPQLALPQGFDQVIHGQRIEALGVGASLPWKKRSAARLAEALARLDTPEVADRARALADELVEEDGPGRAADELEDLLAA